MTDLNDLTLWGIIFFAIFILGSSFMGLLVWGLVPLWVYMVGVIVFGGILIIIYPKVVGEKRRAV